MPFKVRLNYVPDDVGEPVCRRIVSMKEIPQVDDDLTVMDEAGTAAVTFYIRKRDWFISHRDGSLPPVDVDLCLSVNEGLYAPPDRRDLNARFGFTLVRVVRCE